ncbi:MAG: class IV adenylate cyclase [Chloroflexota bacterium]
MAKDNLENELKLYMPDLGAVAQRIEAAGGKISAPRVLERNIRYDDSANWLSARGIVLRLRQDSRARLTYKEGERLVGDYGSSRYEAEVEVSDFATMETILTKVGFHPVFIYDKYRTTYALEGAEVTLDEMPYGNFVEIEGDEDAIRRVVEKLELQGARRMTASYTSLFKFVKKNLALKFNDLTFENFQGIDVPESAFDSE